MNRYIVIGGVGVAILVLALSLSFWLSSDDETAPETATLSTPTQPVQPLPQVESATTPATPQPQISVAPSTPQPQISVAPVTPQPQMSVAPPTPQPQISVAPTTPRPEPSQPAPLAAAPSESPPPAAAEVAIPPVFQVVPRVDPPASTAPKPEFDIVRIDRSGNAVIAGRAEPGAAVTVLDADQELGTVVADSRGEWVLVPEEPIKPGSAELGLSSELEDGRVALSESVIVIVVPERGKDVTGQPVEEPSVALVIEVPRKGFGASKVLQKPASGATQPEPGIESGSLSVDVLDYDDSGNLSLTGSARPGSDVRVYLDNELLGRAAAGADQRWQLKIAQAVAPGLYTLRVDEVSGDKVVARLEFPFSRADPTVIEQASRVVVVQPGNSLWRIARRTMGDGLKFSVIYEANLERIRDPDLIYPGQIFEVPRTY